MLETFSQLPLEVHIVSSALLGLMVGSFLNVIIFRLPKTIHYEWTTQCCEWLKQDAPKEEAPHGIIFPPSHCMHCKKKLKAWHNIPVISYLLLAGKCQFCSKSISIRYPLVELLTAIVSATVVFKLGFSTQSAWVLLLSWALIALSFIDFDHQILPDNITLPFLWLGLFLSLWGIFATPEDAIIGAIAGYLSLWLVFHGFKLLTGKEGMGYGDFKLLSLFGAWLGWQSLPLVILMSTIAGSILGISLILLRIIDRNKPIPFGPYLAIAGWITLLWGDEIIQRYLYSIGL